ncbi:hypothetical protein [Psychrobacillus sp. NPDC096623]|uniref:hypothetical protein n=1 Tax=Psychrobacillus sp. NPDC096623 TaxID=3364492 RepID=UPI0037F79828
MEELLGLGLGFVAIILTFSIPLSAIWTNHLRKSQKIRALIVKDEIELEKLRYNNFLVETEKMRLDLQLKQASLLESTDPLVLDLQKRSVNEAQTISY